MPLERISRTCFKLIHGRNLVYNQCWEDPRLDRQALELTGDHDVLVITSAGCNALDYALAGANHVYAVDMNFRQNALLELKKAAIRTCDYNTFFQIFGQGRLPEFNTVYPEKLRPELPEFAQQFWDRHGKFFRGAKRRPSFYFHGTSGLFAWMVNGYINRVARIRRGVNEILEAKTLEEQQEIYQRNRLKESLFRPLVQWMLNRDTTMAMLGVPRSQRRQLDVGYPGGIVQFIVDRIDTVFSKLPLSDNYFWRVYLTGQYTPECCPEYLKPENFDSLRNGIVNNVTTHTDSVLDFLEKHPGKISRFVLLDHMDWLYSNYQEVLTAEWQGIVDKAAEDARVIWRSAGLKVDFVDPIEVQVNGSKTKMGELLHYNQDLAAELHPIDRVNTYGSFYIADLRA
ncbi:MAG: BtaA family protein [Planctomycetaceae bacterium]|nr:BtaA family protein [Planctomycetaceae bacterium]